MNIDELREKTNTAIRRGKEKAEAEKQRQRDQEQQRLAVAKKWVEVQMTIIPGLVEEAAEAGQFRCTIASTRGNNHTVKARPFSTTDYHSFPGWETGHQHGLQYSLLEQSLKEAGFKVEIKYQHDGVGVSSWFEMEISWD